jgi:hypothetical protein
MAGKFDVYREWLGIHEPERPLTHYQLLRVPRFCDDVARIRENYRKMNAHVRKFGTGDYARQSQELLNELARAMLALTDATRKREYDAALGREETTEGRRRTLEEILLVRKVIDQAQLKKARAYAEAVGLETRDALVQQKMATAEVVMQAYAESQGLPYVELADVGVAEDLVPKVPPALGRNNSCVPLMVDGGQVLMAAPHLLAPDVEDELRLRFAMPVRTVLCVGASINPLVEKYYPREAVAAGMGAGGGNSPGGSVPAQPTPAVRPVQPQEKLVAVLGFAATGFCALVAFTFYHGGWDLLAITDYLLILVLALAGGAGAFFIARRQTSPDE